MHGDPQVKAINRLLLLVLAILGCVVSDDAIAQEAKPITIDFESLPSDAVVVGAIRDQIELRAKVKAWLKRTDARQSMILGSIANAVVPDVVGLPNGLHSSGSFGVALYDAEGSFAIITHPYKSLDQTAKAYDVSPDQLASGKLMRADVATWLSDSFWCGLRNKNLVVGMKDSAARAMHAGTLSSQLDPKTAKSFSDDDLFLTFNLSSVRELLDQGEAPRKHPVLQLVPTDLVRAAASSGLIRTCCGLRIDDGLEFTLAFDFRGDEPEAVLAAIASKAQRSDLNGLPVGDLMFATAQSVGSENFNLLRTALPNIAPDFFGITLDGANNIASPQHLAGLKGLFNEGIQHVQRSRLALYRNEKVEEDGDFSLILILDTDDGAGFVREIRETIPVVDVALNTANENSNVDEKQIRKMVSFLSHDNVRAREFMVTKLRLLGRRALSELGKAAKSSDETVKMRAQKLIVQIKSDLGGEQAKFLSGKLIKQLKPTLSYQPNSERRSGCPVDIVHLELQEADQQVAGQANTFLGPDWNRIRVARINDQVVVMLGSGTDLFDQALKNLIAGKPGLESQEQFKRFRQNAPGGLLAELHVSMAQAKWLSGPREDTWPGGNAKTSLGLSVSPKQLRLDFLVPFEEVDSAVDWWW